MAKKTTRPKSPASPPFKITVPLPTTNKKKKKQGPAGGPKPKRRKKDKAEKQLPRQQFRPPKMKDPISAGRIKPKLQEPQLLPERKVPKGEKPNMLDVAGGAKTVNVKGGGLMEATKRLKAQGLKKGGFPDLSGDGKITMKDVLMGRGVIKKPKKKAMGGSMTLEKGKLKGVKDAPEERRRERAKRVPKGLAMGIAGAMKGTARAMKKAGRLALRGYGKARK
jgi:hypothetical protein